MPFSSNITMVYSLSDQCPWLYVLCLVTQSCPTLCDPVDCSPPGSSVCGTLQARTLEWVAISFPSAWKWKVKVKLLSVWLLVTPWTVAHQAPPSIGFSRQEYWRGHLLEMQNLRLTLGTTESQALGVGPSDIFKQAVWVTVMHANV